MLLDKIKKLVYDGESNELGEIWTISLDIIKDIKNHTKQITTQLSIFDIHDEKHSEEVIAIIENLLGF